MQVTEKSNKTKYDFLGILYMGDVVRTIGLVGFILQELERKKPRIKPSI